MKIFTLPFLGFIAACSSGDPISSEFSRPDADALAKSCDADPTWLSIDPDGGVIWEAPVDADYEASACLLNGIKEADVTKFGFIGDEKSPSEND